MKRTPPTFLALLLVVLVVACGNDETAPRPADAIFGVVVSPDGSPAADAVVTLLRRWPFIPDATVVVDSTATDRHGSFEFPDLEEGSWRVAAARWSADRAAGYDQVGPISAELSTGETAPPTQTIRMLNVRERGEIAGVVMRQPTREPAEGAMLSLWRLEGGGFVPADTVTAGADGVYRFEGVRTANCIVQGSDVYWSEVGDSQLPIFEETRIFFSDGATLARPDTLWLSDVHVDKPVITIHPDRPGPFSVRLAFGEGVALTRSDPSYGDGWDVRVDAQGAIAGAPDDLFYEIATTPQVLAAAPVAGDGWCLARGSVDAELAAVGRRCGLPEAEAAACAAYWDGRLPDDPWWLVRPVFDADLDRWVRLEVTPTPDAVRRVWFLFRASDAPVALPAPQPRPFVGTGTTVVEWGGAVIR